MSKYSTIGVMSGTSLDGLDVALCTFEKVDDKWEFEIQKAQTFEYSDEWRYRLDYAVKINVFEFLKLHKEYGNFIGATITEFLSDYDGTIDLIASHGHTTFHQPQHGITFQIGDGAAIAATTGLTTISDFRSFDVTLGGQGAPLVPVGDMMLFYKYDFCLNLGGFGNISYQTNGSRIAFDISPVNLALNYLAQKKGHKFDMDGQLGRKGKLDLQMLERLSNLGFYTEKPPKSLGREWLEAYFLPIIEDFDLPVEDKLRTVYEHIAEQILFSIQDCLTNEKKSILITGGGANNSFLIDLIRQKTAQNVVIPDTKIVEFKEALIFAFLGVLRIRNEANCLSSVTGAKFDNIGGIVYQM